MDTRFSRSELQTKFLSEFRVSILEGRTKISCTVQMDSLGSFCLELLLFVCFICQKFKGHDSSILLLRRRVMGVP